MYTISEGYAPFRRYQTRFRVCGDIDSGLTPLVIAHGGPGCTHDYVDAFRDIALSGRAVIHYDQLGNGRSTHLPQQPADFWQPALFLDELANLLQHLNIADHYALLGQSWGGMLGAEHAVTRPKGLKALIIANSPASMALWLQGAAGCGRSCPPTSSRRCWPMRRRERWTARNIRRQAVFYQRHVCRLDHGRRKCGVPSTPWMPTRRFITP